MAQADSPNTTILCKPGCACPDCLEQQEAEAERLGPENLTDLQLFQRDLRDCFEGCIPYVDAIEMIGAPDEFRTQLRADWRRWTRAFEG
jgi:hypothetical protein